MKLAFLSCVLSLLTLCVNLATLAVIVDSQKSRVKTVSKTLNNVRWTATE